VYTNSLKEILNNKEAKNYGGSREIFSRFFGFHRYHIEQQIPTRPADKERRKMYYSGKKIKHTVKNQVTVNNRGFIIHKANHKKGKRHDYDVYKNNHPVTPNQVVNVIDLGYLGVEKDFPEQLSALPHKRNRNQEELLPQEEKEYKKSIPRIE